MKLMIVLLAVLAGVWLWRRGRRLTQSQRPPSRSGERGVQAMTRCRLCQLHLPAADAVTGRQGDYCSAAHREQAEGA